MSYSNAISSQLSSAGLLRRIFGRYGNVRGVPRLLWWLRRLAFPPMPTLVETPDGLPVVINREDYGQLMLYYFPYCRELQALLTDVIRPGDICLDLGANVGLLTACMANCVGTNGKVIAVEPNPPVAAQLESMVEDSFPERVVVVSVGISAQDGTGVLQSPVGSFSESMEVTQSSGDGEPLELLSIDTLCDTHIPGCTPNFIKVDIEGNEAYLIESMAGLFSRGCRPLLLIEFHPEKCERRGVPALRIVQQLGALGYQKRQVVIFQRGYRLLDGPSLHVAHENILFVPSGYLSAYPILAANWNDEK